MKLTAGVLAVVLALGAGAALAAEVTIEGAHICCPQCRTIIGETLGGVDGVSNAACEQGEGGLGTITFEADSEEAAQAALEALASEAGIHGDATIDGQEIAFPPSGAEEAEPANRVELTNVHLCCPQCERFVAAALQDIECEVVCDRVGQTVVCEGENLDPAAIVEALNAAGFNATLAE